MKQPTELISVAISHLGAIQMCSDSSCHQQEQRVRHFVREEMAEKR